MDIYKIAKDAKFASLQLQNIKTEVKNDVLKNITLELEKSSELIFSANKKDLYKAI